MELKTQHRVDIYQKLASLLGSGISIQQAMMMLKDQERDRAAKNVFASLSNGLNKGKSFSDAYARVVKNTNHFEIPLIRAGEKAGSLVEVLSQLGDAIERDQSVWKEFVNKAKGTVFMLHAAAFLFPGMELLHGKIGLPMFIVKAGAVLSIFYFSAYLCWKALSPSSLSSKNANSSNAILSAPFLGVLLKRIEAFRFIFSYWILNKAGIDKKETLRVACGTGSFDATRKVTREVGQLLVNGNPLYNSKKAILFFPDNFLAAWHTGVVSGEEDQILEREIHKLEAEIQKRTDTLVFVLNKTIYLFVLAITAYGIVRFYLGRFDALKGL